VVAGNGTLNSSLHATLLAGSFHPNSLLLLLAFPPRLLWGSREAYAVLWHEYIHYLQATTTSYGINSFIREFVVAEETIRCLRKLSAYGVRVQLPLREWLETTPSREIRTELATFFRIHDFVESDQALLHGCVEINTENEKAFYKGEPILKQEACLQIMYEKDSVTPFSGPIGARSLMEGNASLLIQYYLLFMAKAGQDQKADELWRRWLTDWEPTVYFETIDLAYNLLGEKYDPALIWVLSDLALCPPAEYPLAKIDFVSNSRYPGLRYRDLLLQAQSLPELTLGSLHHEYERYVSSICGALGWSLPWKETNEMLRTFLKQKAANSILADCIPGPGAAYLSGLRLRETAPLMCVFPFPDVPRILGMKSTQDRRTVVYWEQIFLQHPPPFVVMGDGTRLLSSAIAALAADGAIGGTVSVAQAEESFRLHYFAQCLSEVIRDGQKQHLPRILDCMKAEDVAGRSCPGADILRCQEGRHPVCAELFETLTEIVADQVDVVGQATLGEDI